MQPEQPLLSHHTSQNTISFSILMTGQQSTFTLDDQIIKLGTNYIKRDDATGLILDQIQSNKDRKYSLYSYPRSKKTFKSIQRYVQRVQFVMPHREDSEDIEKKVIYLIANRHIGESLKVFVCYNPNAGSNSRSHLNKILEFFKKTNLEPEVFTTQHRGHCKEHLKTLNPKQYCAVAIVSGDGLMHEFVNSKCKIPVTHVPAGSGNAFAKTQTEKAGQLCKDEETIFLIIKNRKFNFNIVKYQLEKVPEPVYSFLSLEWAFLGDIDMNSQFLRCIGGLRFQVYSVWRLIKMKRYRGRITYSTIESQMPSFQTDLSNHPNYVSREDTYLHTIFCSIPYISDKFHMAPCVKLDEKFIDFQTLREEHGRFQLAKYLLSSDSGSHFDVEQGKPAEGFRFDFHKVKSFRIEPLDPNQPGIYGIDGEEYESQKIQAGICEETFQSFV